MNDAIKTIKPRSVKKTSPEQFELLRAEMTTHTAAALGYGSGRDRTVVDEEWKDIMLKLNAIGPPFRTLPEWKKVWSDVRLRSKKSLCEEFQRKCKSESDDDILMETLNNASVFYNSHNSSDQDYAAQQENNVEQLLPAPTMATRKPSERNQANRLKRKEYQYRTEERNRKKKTTPEQFRLLKQEMAKHPLAAKGYGTGKDRYRVDAEWREILEKLNKLGPPYRNMTEWKKVWSDVRLRVRKSMGKPAKPSKHKRIKKEAVSENDDILESLNENSSIYNGAEANYSVPQIVEVNSSISASNNSNSNNNNTNQPFVSDERNPLDENDFLDNNDETTSYHAEYQISDVEDSQCNDTIEPPHLPTDNVMEQTLNALQMHAEQHDKIVQQLSKISTTMSTVLHNQTTAAERRNQLLAAQTKSNDFHNYMQRRHELRRKGRCKISEWF